MFPWFTGLSTYYIRLERLLILAGAILLFAFLSFGIAPAFWVRAVLFVVCSVALFNIEPIMNRLWGKLKLTEADQTFVEELRKSGLPEKEQKILYRNRIPGTSWQAAAVIVLVWFILLELLVTLGGARFLAQFPWVQELAGLIPSELFAKEPRSEHDILKLKIFKIFNVSSLPFKICSVYVLSTPFWKNPKTFPISPMAIHLNKMMLSSTRVKKYLWTFFASLIFLFLGAGGVFVLIWNDYGSFKHGLLVLSGVLNIHSWLWFSVIFSIFMSVFLSCFIRIVLDGFCLIVSLFNYGKVRVHNE